MTFALLLLALAAAEPAPVDGAGGVIEATVRGTREPVEVELLLRREDESWEEVAHRNLSSQSRQVRFDGLGPGVYQIRVLGSEPYEQFGTKVGLGQGDERRTTIAIEPREVSGRITLGGIPPGAGTLVLRHREFRWEAAIPIGQDGTFRAPLWQSGAFTCSVRAPALPTPYSTPIELNETPVAIDIPDGRITGVVRDAKSGLGIAGVPVALQTNAGSSEQHVRTTTDARGRFDFVGMKYGRHKVRISAPAYLDAAPVAFDLTAAEPLRELDVALESGRAIPLVVVGADGDPVAEATVYALSGTALCGRTTTDEDGRTEIAVPERGEAVLFVIRPEGGFAVARVTDAADARLRIDLPPPSSSLLMRAQTNDGTKMPAFSLLMRYDGAVVPVEILEELTAVQGLQFGTGADGQVRLDRIPAGSYEFWPYRTEEEAEAIVASGDEVAAPIRVQVRGAETRVAVKFAAR